MFEDAKVWPYKDLNFGGDNVAGCDVKTNN